MRNALLAPASLERETRTVLTRSLDERDLVDLLQGRDATADAVERRFAQEMHAVFARHPPDLRGRFLVEDHLTHAIGQVQQLVDRGAASEARPGAFNATLSFVERDRTPFLRVEPAGFQLIAGVANLLAAVVTC